MQLGPVEGFPVQVSKDLSKPTARQRRELSVWLYPDEYLLFQAFCKSRRSALSTMARSILLAYVQKMIARDERERR